MEWEEAPPSFASLPHARGLSADADARLLWRKKPFRIEGEVLRDSMLVTRAHAWLMRRLAPGPSRAAMAPDEYLRALPAFRRNLENLRLSCAAFPVLHTEPSVPARRVEFERDCYDGTAQTLRLAFADKFF